MKIRRPHLLVALLSLSACTPDSTGPGESVTEVRVSPESPSIDVGLTIQFFAQALDASGQAMTGLPVTWASNDQAVATIDAEGFATGVSVGVVAITRDDRGRVRLRSPDRGAEPMSGAGHRDARRGTVPILRRRHLPPPPVRSVR